MPQTPQHEDSQEVLPRISRKIALFLEDPRYLLGVKSTDTITRSVHKFRIRCLDVPELYNKRLLASGLLSPLSGKFPLVAMALCDCVLAEQFVHSYIEFPVSDLRRLASKVAQRQP